MTENEWWQTEENDEVATSPELWRPLSDAIGGFDLDPAAGCEPTPIADNRYTVEDDGLSSPWFGNVWLNPPFSEKTAWYRRLVSQYNSGNVARAVAIGRDGWSAEWFQRWFARADVLCLLSRRQWYTDSGSPSFSTVVGVWNPTPDLQETLCGMGTVVIPRRDDAQTDLRAHGDGS